MREIRIPMPVAVLGLALLCLLVGAWLGSATAQQQTVRMVQPEGEWLIQPLDRVTSGDRQSAWMYNAKTAELIYLDKDKATRVNLPD